MNETTGKQSFYLNAKGSLHKNHYNGSNYLLFTFQDLQEQINHLCKNLCINPNEAQISTLEIGLNICTPFEVTPFIRRNILCYKGYSFNYYKPDRQGKCLGKYCAQPKQYSIKIYDKGLQFDLPENLMRFEQRFLKMQPLNKRGIKYLSDLQNLTKVDSLKEILFKAWNDVLIFDIPAKTNRPIKQAEKDLLNDGKNPMFWEGLKETVSQDQYKYQTRKFKKLVAKHGNNWQTLVNDLLKNEWQNLFKNYPNLPSGQKDILPEFTIKIKGKKGEKVFPPEKRYCVSCGNELNPAQKKDSKFCSAKYVGYEKAHDCRLKESNPRNNFKNKIKKITARGLLFDIMPFIDPGKRKFL